MAATVTLPDRLEAVRLALVPFGPYGEECLATLLQLNNEDPGGLVRALDILTDPSNDRVVLGSLLSEVCQFRLQAARLSIRAELAHTRPLHDATSDSQLLGIWLELYRHWVTAPEVPPELR